MKRKKQTKYCKGMNCNATAHGDPHSVECEAERAAALAGGVFLKATHPRLAELQGRITQIASLLDAYATGGETLLLHGREGAFDLFEAEMFSAFCSIFGREPAATRDVPMLPITEKEVSELWSSTDQTDLVTAFQMFRAGALAASTLLTGRPGDVQQATVWHGGSLSYYRAALIEKLSADDVRRETAAACGEAAHHPV